MASLPLTGTLLCVLRSAVFFCWLVLMVVIFASGVLLLSIFVRGNPVYALCVAWAHTVLWGARAICGVRYRVHGMQNLPSAAKTDSVILLSKHQSAWETCAFPALMPHPLAYVFKRELLYIPFFGWGLARLDMVHIDRSKRAEALQRVAIQGARLMARGHWIIIFPEGTRTVRGRQGTYKLGGARLAVATGRPVVPVAVSSARCWPRRSFLLRPGVIDMSIARPIEAVGREPEELMHEVETWIEAEMRRIDPEAYASA